MQNNNKGIKYRISKWIMLALAILTNGFIVFYSCLSQETTNAWNRTFTNAFTKVINDLTKKDVVTVALDNINIGFSSVQSHKYNYVPGYELNEIPLGSAKEVSCNFSPENASNQSIIYSVEPSDAAILNQTGSIVSVIGMKEGNAKLIAISEDGGKRSEIDFKVISPIAPVSYEVGLDDYNISLYHPKTIGIDIKCEVLGNDSLKTFRYYDIRKLSYSSSDLSIASVDQNGVIYPHAEGSTQITVSNKSFSRSFYVNVVSGSPVANYTNLSIEGSNVCYANDMILDQSSKNNHFQLSIKDNGVDLDPKDFIWESSNNLLARIDQFGILRGFRKTVDADETVTIAAKSKLTGQIAEFIVTVKSQLPNEMYFSFVIGEKTIWNPKDYTLLVGDNIVLKIGYKPTIQKKDVIIDCSDDSIIKVSNEGGNVTLHVLKEGTCTIKMTSLANPNLSLETKYTIVKPGFITKERYSDFGLYLRKSIGHAAVFMIAQIFTYLSLYMFFYEKQWWLHLSISLGIGLLLSGLSELIQYFIPGRSGALLDVLIDFSGVLVGAALTLLGIIIVKKIIKTKKARSHETR